MISLYDDYRTITYEYRFTESSYRICVFSYLLGISERFCTLIYFTESEITCIATFPQLATSERKVFTDFKTLDGYDERFCETLGAGVFDERLSHYTISINVFIYDTELRIPQMLHSTRSVFVYEKPSDYRFVYVNNPVISERLVKPEVYIKPSMYDLEIVKPITDFSSRSVYVEYAYTDLRFIYYEPIEFLNSERYVGLSIYRDQRVFDLEVIKPIEMYEEVSCTCESSIAFSEIQVIVNDYAVDFFCICDGIVQEQDMRKCTYEPMIVALLYDMEMINAIPEVSEVICYTDAFVYNTERKVYIETRRLYITKKYPSNYATVFGVSIDKNLISRKIYSPSTIDTIVSYSGIKLMHTEIQKTNYVQIYLFYPLLAQPVMLSMFTDRGEVLSNSIENSEYVENVFTMKMVLKIIV